MLKPALVVALGISFGLVGMAAPHLVIYSQGAALVEETRVYELSSEGTLIIGGLPQEMLLESLSIEGITVLSVKTVPFSQAELGKLVGKYVEVISPAGTFRGRVVSAGDQGIALATDSGFVFIKDYQALRVPYPLLRQVEVRYRSDVTDRQALKIRYLTQGISWQARYQALLGEGKLTLFGVATLSNSTGVRFSSASVDLIAGSLRMPFASQGYGGVRALAASPEMAAISQAGEYHRYSLPEPVTLDSATVMVPLVSTTVPYQRAYLFRGGPVETVIRFRNGGTPLPSGLVYFYEEGGGLFVGAGSIGHTPAGKEVELAIGTAFDLTGKQVQLAHRLEGKEYVDTYQVTISSAKDQPVQVEVWETLPGIWSITKSSVPYEQVNADTVKFLLGVPAKGKAVLTYTVRWSKP